MKKILLVDCHPKAGSLSHALLESYHKGALQAGHKIRIMRLSEMQFDSNLELKENDEQPLEHDLQMFQENLKWCEHVVFAHPLWWGLMPAKMKGLIDRTFLPNFAYAYNGKSSLPDKLLKGRSADILVTSDTPKWAFNLLYRAAVFKAMRMQIFEFVGFKPAKFYMFSSVKKSNLKIRRQWLAKAFKLGSKL